MNKEGHRDRVWPASDGPLLSSFYGWLLLAFFTMWIIALGGSLWGQSNPWYFQWQSLMFDPLCHQLPERSFWLAGQPMAVCIRCFGIYSGLLFGWLTVPWWNGWINYSTRFAVISGVLTLLLNVVDASLDFFIVEHPLHADRWIYGALLGVAAVLILNLKSNTCQND